MSIPTYNPHLRDEMAMAAMQAWMTGLSAGDNMHPCANDDPQWTSEWALKLAKWSYLMADAMLVVRDETRAKP